MKNYVISEEQINAVLVLLVSKPYGEVATTIRMLTELPVAEEVPAQEEGSSDPMAETPTEGTSGDMETEEPASTDQQAGESFPDPAAAAEGNAPAGVASDNAEPAQQDAAPASDPQQPQA